MKRIHVILMIVFILVFSATAAVAQSLTGVWACNDGGKYYLTQSGNVLW